MATGAAREPEGSRITRRKDFTAAAETVRTTGGKASAFAGAASAAPASVVIDTGEISSNRRAAESLLRQIEKLQADLEAAVSQQHAGSEAPLRTKDRSVHAVRTRPGMARRGQKIPPGIDAGVATAVPSKDEERLAEQLVSEIAKGGPDVNTLCRTYQLRREELGRLTGFSLRALAEWAGGKLPSQPAKRRLHEVRRLLDALTEIVEPASIPQWLHQSNPAFDRLTPLQVIEVGEIDRLWAMVYELGSGQPS